MEKFIKMAVALELDVDEVTALAEDAGYNPEEAAKAIKEAYGKALLSKVAKQRAVKAAAQALLTEKATAAAASSVETAKTNIQDLMALRQKAINETKRLETKIEEAMGEITDLLADI